MKLVISEKPLKLRGEGGSSVSFAPPFDLEGCRSLGGMLLTMRSFAIEAQDYGALGALIYALRADERGRVSSSAERREATGNGACGGQCRKLDALHDRSPARPSEGERAAPLRQNARSLRSRPQDRASG